MFHLNSKDKARQTHQYDSVLRSDSLTLYSQRWAPFIQYIKHHFYLTTCCRLCVTLASCLYLLQLATELAATPPQPETRGCLVNMAPPAPRSPGDLGRNSKGLKRQALTCQVHRHGHTKGPQPRVPATPPPMCAETTLGERHRTFWSITGGSTGISGLVVSHVFIWVSPTNNCKNIILFKKRKTLCYWYSENITA